MLLTFKIRFKTYRKKLERIIYYIYANKLLLLFYFFKSAANILFLITFANIMYIKYKNISKFERNILIKIQDEGFAFRNAIFELFNISTINNQEIVY